MADFINARVIQKIATVSEWSTSTIIPYKGEIMLVSDSTGKVINIKVGDGINHFNDLPYMFESLSNFNISDANDVSVEGRTDGQVLSWNAAINKWVARNEQSGPGDLDTLQSVTDRGNVTSLDIAVRGVQLTDFLGLPNTPPDPTDVLSGRSYVWLVDGATAGIPDAGTLAGLSDVNITSPTNGQSLVWNDTALKWENATVSGGGGGTWGSITGVLSNQTDLQNALNGKANLVHTHAASDIISGVLNIARIPTGTTAGTVALGNDSRINNGQTAYEWGDFRDFGLGTNPNVTDADLITESRFFSTSSSHAFGYGSGIHLGRYEPSGVRAGQLHIENIGSGSEPVVKVRSHNSSGWGTIRTLWHSGNLRSDAQNDARYMQVTAPANGITTGDISNWNTAYSQRHTHSNKAFLDVINQNLATTASVQFSGANIVDSLRIPVTAPTTPLNGNLWLGDGATAGVPSAGTLVGLSDVDIASPTNGQALVWDSATSKWVNGDVASGGGTWGSITGVLSNQTDLQNALNGKANLVHTHAASDIISGVLNIARIPTGTSGSTVALGNDSRINNGQTAYEWGNHATQGYFKYVSALGNESIDGITVSGFYQQQTSANASVANNYPNGAVAGMLRHYNHSFYKEQYYSNRAGGRTWYRTFYASWSDWVEFWHSGNLRSNAQNDARYMQVTAPANGITTGDITNWNTAYSQRHTHANKAFLDTVNQNMGTANTVTFAGIIATTRLRIPTSAPSSPANGEIWIDTSS